MEIDFDSMKKAIDKTGGLFYQYRPCRRDIATIYDIENIRHGVVYAQTPLNMNDPFDSMIGYSSEKIYDNCITMLLDAVEIDDNTKVVLPQMLRSKVLGKIAELLSILNELKEYIITKQSLMHETNIPITDFVQQNIKRLYSDRPHCISKVFTRETFYIFASVVSKIDKIDITEQALNDIFNLDIHLSELYNEIVMIKDTVYIPYIKKFLSQLTVSCFSTSGWNNQLMWSHYANSYSGICIEYDFSKIEKFIGFIYPVEYVRQRPILSLNDLGIKGITLGNETTVDYGDPNMKSLFKYLLAKNVCWEYEKEWRIINFGKENTPLFLDLPFIKSITFGQNIDPICKHMMCDICQEKGIGCYEIVANVENFSLSRKQLREEDLIYDIHSEIEYIDILFQQTVMMSERANKLEIIFGNNQINFTLLKHMLFDTLDLLTNAYFLKVSFNRLCDYSEEDISFTDIPKDSIETLKMLEKFTFQIKEIEKTLNEALPILCLIKAISNSDHQIIEKQLCDLKELIEKYESIDWNTIYIGTDYPSI